MLRILFVKKALGKFLIGMVLFLSSCGVLEISFENRPMDTSEVLVVSSTPTALKQLSISLPSEIPASENPIGTVSTSTHASQTPSPPTSTPFQHEPIGSLSIHMTDESNGWATMHKMSNGFSYQAILHSDDGGYSWFDVTPPETFDTELGERVHVFFADELTAWVTYGISLPEGGDNNRSILPFVWSTHDAGQTWTPSQLLDYPDHSFPGYLPVWLGFSGSIHGWLVAHIGPLRGNAAIYNETLSIFRTHDGGLTWTESVDSPYSFLCCSTGMDFTSEGSGIVSFNIWDKTFMGGWVHLLWTKDGGSSWVEHRLPPPDTAGEIIETENCYPYAPDLFSSSYAMVVLRCKLDEGDPAFLYTTKDAGITWHSSPYPFPITHSYEGPHWLNNLVGWAHINGGIFQTLDGGQTWIEISELPGLDDVEFNFVNIQTGWAQARMGDSMENILLHTHDGGRTWETIDPILVIP